MKTMQSSALFSDVTIHPIKSEASWGFPDLKELWHSRELIYFFVLRDLKARYKQTIFGWTWALLQPLLTMVVFTMVFSIIARVPTGSIPYPVFNLSGLLLWTFFVTSFRGAANSLTSNGHLVRKVYFPRLVFPLADIFACLVDFIISLPLLVGMLLFFRVTPSLNVMWIPLFVFIAMLTAFGFGLWFAAINVRYRDIGHFLPFLTQVWMYATPVVYPYDLVPQWLRPFYDLNPMVGVIDGMRWALLGTGGRAPDISLVYSTLGVILITITGLVFFKRMEAEFADVV